MADAGLQAPNIPAPPWPPAQQALQAPQPPALSALQPSQQGQQMVYLFLLNPALVTKTREPEDEQVCIAVHIIWNICDTNLLDI